MLCCFMSSYSQHHFHWETLLKWSIVEDSEHMDVITKKINQSSEQCNAAHRRKCNLQSSGFVAEALAADCQCRFCTFHISISLFMFVFLFISEQPDSSSSPYFPRRVPVLHAWRIASRCKNSNPNLSVSQKNRLLGEITLLYLAAHWLRAVSLDPAATHFIPIYHKSTHPSSRLNSLFFS